MKTLANRRRSSAKRETAGLPNFLIIGAARSGTTTLYANLQEHPDIYLHAPKRPEPHFFLKEQEYAKGIGYYSEKYFTCWEEQAAAGEVSASYICHESVAARIHKHLPDVRLIVTLRHPVDRAFSSYWHTMKSGLETLSFEEAVEREAERLVAPENAVWREIQPFAYAGRGFYYAQLKNYLKYFARDQMLILLFDDLVGRPAETIRQIFRFLEVDETFVPPSLGMSENGSTPPGAMMLPETRRILLERFREDTENLATFLGRDLRHWQV